MANGIVQLIIIGLAFVVASGVYVALNPLPSPDEDVKFLERVAATVVRAQVIAPRTRDFLAELVKRHQSSLPEPQLDLRRRKALARIIAATQQADRPMPGLVAALGLEPRTR